MGFEKMTPAQRAAAGRKGGNKTKQRMLAKNPNYYEEIGFSGGQKLKAERGVEYFRGIGLMGKKTKKEEL